MGYMHHFIEPLSDHEQIQMIEYLIEVVCQWFREHRSIEHGHVLLSTIGNTLVLIGISTQPCSFTRTLLYENCTVGSEEESDLVCLF